jgi:hypothetical protein
VKEVGRRTTRGEEQSFKSEKKKRVKFERQLCQETMDLLDSTPISQLPNKKY